MKCRFCDSQPDHEPCCTAHGAPLCHAHYRRTHFVEKCGCKLCERDLVAAGQSGSPEQ